MFSGADASEVAPSRVQEGGSEVFPNDSASAIDENYSEVGRRNGAPASSVGLNGVVPPATVDDGTYLFKFVAPGGTTHRFQARYDSYEFIVDIVGGKLSADPFFSANYSTPPIASAGATEEETLKPKSLDPKDFQICYYDDDGDLVLISADQDILDAVAVARKQGKDRVMITLRGPAAWEDEIERKASVLASKKALASTPVPVLKSVGEENEDEEPEEKVEKKSRKGRVVKEELVFGFLSPEQLLPASVAFLAIAIVGVFSFSKATSK